MKRILITVATALVVASGMFPARAGTAINPEISDVAGDANFVNGQGVAGGLGQGPDTRPASVASADLRAAWFETAFATSKVLDPETGRVLRVEHVATGLRLHIRTEAAIYPTPQARRIDYRVLVDVPECSVAFHLGASGATPEGDLALIRLEACPVPWGTTAASSVSMAGDVASFEWGFAPKFEELIFDGQTLAAPRAFVTPFVISGAENAASPLIVIDEAAPGRNFTIGSDVPPDVDCNATPGHPDCQG